MNKHLVDTSKFLSLVLRHQPELIGIALDNEGWAHMDELIAGARRQGHAIDRATITTIVADNDKKRFAISPDGSRIRAVQGHSTADVTIAYEPRIPPDLLFHGTATRFLSAILAEGLVSGSRHHVHLSATTDTAIAVGQRHGKPTVLRVDAKAMHSEGIAFYQSENGVWLTKHVPVRFLTASDV